MVAVDPIVNEVKIVEHVKPVTEASVETNLTRRPRKKYFRPTTTTTTTTTTMRPVSTTETSQKLKRIPRPVTATETSPKTKRTTKNYNDGKGNYHIAQEYSTRKILPSRSLPVRGKKAGPNKIQPLHIDTEVFKKKRPMVMNGNLKPTKEQKEKIKLHNLPKNPEDIPETSWFDNTGKYHYGIIHDEQYFTEPPEYSAKPQPAAKVIESTPKVWKSSFRNPNIILPVIQNNGNNLGNFLYQTEVHYPTYRNHLYPPVTVYGSTHQSLPAPTTKELPTIEKTETPKKAAPKKEAPKKEAPHAKQQQEDEEDYEDDDDDEGDSDNDRYDGDPPSDDDENVRTKGGENDEDGEDGEDDEEESGSEENDDRPRFRYSYDRPRGAESDEFDKAWSKYGYGRGRDDSGSDESRSYESSETRAVPRRIKFYHEVKEQHTTRPSTTPAPVQIKKMTKVVSGALNHSKPKAPKKPKSVKSQGKEKKAQDEEMKEIPESQRSNAAANAGPDDLKYFQ